MLDLFVKKYSAEDIHNYINVQFLALLNNINQELKETKLPEKYQEELDALKSLNLTESVNYKQIKVLQDKIDQTNELRNKNIELVKFMKALKFYFGDNCIVIKHEDFNTLLDKYNLASGALDDYTGTIPLENLKEISIVKEKLETLDKLNDFLKIEPNCHLENNILYGGYRNNESYWYWSEPMLSFETEDASRVTNTLQEYLSENKYRYIFRLPSNFTQLQSKKDVSNFINEIHKFRDLSKVLRVREDSKYHSIYKNGRTNLILADSFASFDMETSDTNFKLFIVAPAQEMNCKVKVSKFIKSEDPFVCGYTDLGIVIFSSWGDEANDEIIKRYKELQTYL